jgi:predicted O-methyltransferase YrrM
VEIGAFVRNHNLYSHPRAIAGFRMLRRGAARLGLQIVPRTFYSPIPDLDALAPDAFERRSTLAGVRFDLDAQLVWLRDEVSIAMRDFDPPPAALTTDHVYTRGTASYPLLDATVLYGIMRALRPAQVIELGSGASTLVTAQALRDNADDGAPGRLEVFDPYPSAIARGLDGVTRLHMRRAQDVALETFSSLQAGDVLFVDTTHTVKMGSDVNFIVLEVLPRLAPGVVVHFHDIFLPYEYPRKWLEDFGLYWAEQYLLQAFLSLNADFDVLAAVAALARDRTRELAALLPPGVTTGAGAAFWFRRTA